MHDVVCLVVPHDQQLFHEITKLVGALRHIYVHEITKFPDVSRLLSLHQLLHDVSWFAWSACRKKAYNSSVDVI